MGLLHAKERESAARERDSHVVSETWLSLQRDVAMDDFSSQVYSKLMSRDDGARHVLAQTKPMQRKRMLSNVIDWAIQPPEEERIRWAAVQHAHLGVRSSHITLLCECIVETVTTSLADSLKSGSPIKERKAHNGSVSDTPTDSAAAAWHRCLSHLASLFAPTCEEHCEALCQARDTSSAMSTSDSAKKARAINFLTSPQQPPGYSGMLSMSQYSCMKRPPPQAARDHDMHCFRDRWIELRSQYVYYFKEDGAQPIGLIDLALCQLVDTSSPSSSLPCPPTRYTFALVTQAHDYPYYFAAENEGVKEHWFTTLRQACNRFSLIRTDMHVGDRVKVWCKAKSGFAVCTVKWVDALVGPPPNPEAAQHKDGLWVGVEFRDEVGVSDGELGGHRYFTCKKNHGLFVPAHEVKTLGLLEIHVEGDDLAPTRYRPEDFDFLSVLGKGSFGRVCKVREKKLGTLYACKVLQKAALLKESQIRNVSREKSILLNIRHPYIVKLHAAFQTRGRLFLLFDFLSGGELFVHMTRSASRHFDERRAQFYIAEVMLAIDHLHRHDIVHRDLKAENLVLDAEGHVVLTDFGFAKTIDRNEANTTKCGTLPYMAPEMLQQGPNGYGVEVDLWALGVLLFLMLTGCYPFWAEEQMQTVRQILERDIQPKAFPVRPFLSMGAKDLVTKLLTKEPSARLSSSGFIAHRWFKSFDWAACRVRNLQPPPVPEDRSLKLDNSGYSDSPTCREPQSEGGCTQAAVHAPQPSDAFASFYDVHTDYKAVSVQRAARDDSRA
eukprot:TRINITY_DN40002_c0_g1_i1.p1 TRINITY_DN40002_c0_g1~~TRINITY_DN40002_c0_g1_i1.p1  ORF type:complete len:778 (+),score=199.73 TRINITY_DN40002_c0_g1_i1:124-2457(+)